MTLGKQIRILLLLLLLLTTIAYTKMQKHYSTDWNKPLAIVVYPVNIDQHSETERYISQLTAQDFSAIDAFTKKQSQRWQLGLSEPTHTRLGEEISELPPAPPNEGAGIFTVMLWSLQFRYWAWVNTPKDDATFLTVRIFVLYQHADKGEAIAHSLGLSKGLLAYVNAFAHQGQTEQNNIVIAHEFLHTVGALDKYDASGEPIYPQGYADPERTRYPQRQAEIMAGRTPISTTESYMPDDLSDVVIGKETAFEIRWLNGGAAQ